MVGFLADSDEEKAVEEILSQAMDSTVLEQVAAINCAGFSDSALPSHLVTRFQKLKSFPSKRSVDSSNRSELKKCCLVDETQKSGGNIEDVLETLDKKEKAPATCSKKCLSEKDEVSTQSWSSFESESPPMKKSGCFLCSRKKVITRKKMSKVKMDLDLQSKSGEFLTDLSNFSSRSQRLMMKKAMKEEENICREAEKIVKWAKQASSRMDISCIEDLLSDDDDIL